LGFIFDFKIISKGRDSNQGDLNIFKPNLNGIQNRIKSNNLFGHFSNLEL
jgi:hypothetical protein